MQAQAGTRGGLGYHGGVVRLSVAVAVFGWQSAWFLSGALLFTVMVVGGLFVVRPSPESMGLQPDGDEAPPAESRSDRATVAGPLKSLSQN